MHQYDYEMAHAYISLHNVGNTEFLSEVIRYVYDCSIYTGKQKFTGFFKDRVIIITNKHLLFIWDTRKLRQRVALHQIKGMMFYYENKKYNSVIVETFSGEVVKIQTDLPEVNKVIMRDLKAILDQVNSLREV
jgi:hypothetical protein